TSWMSGAGDRPPRPRGGWGGGAPRAPPPRGGGSAPPALPRRIRWRHLAPRRGAGRLLWMCEQMATPLHAADAVPTLYAAATGKGITAPDWTASARPAGCRLDAAGYTTLTGNHDRNQGGPRPPTDPD